MKLLTEGTVTAAYGRQYSKAADAIKDFTEGKDFYLHHYSLGRPILHSIRDYEHGASVKIRFNKNRDAVMHTVNNKQEV